MSRRARLTAWLTGLVRTRRRQDADDLQDEIAFHLAAETEARIDRGQTPEQARAAAERAFGNVPLVAEVTRGMWGSTAWERIALDVRFALRTLVRDRSFTALAVIMLALGIGAAVSVFALVHAVLLAPLPFPEPDRLVMVWERTPPGDPRNLVSAPNYVDWRARSQVFDRLAAISQIPLNVTGFGEAEQVDGVRVTAEFFETLQAPPLVGRWIRSGEDVTGGPRTAVLSHGFWQRRFGADPGVLGRPLAINGDPHEIVGVMSPGFSFPAARAAELYVVLQLNPVPSALSLGRNLITVGRLKPSVTLSEAQADMERVAALTAADRPQLNAGYSATVVPLLDETVRGASQTLWVLFGAVACLLILASANVANLLLMRASHRAPEMAVRTALGAGRLRLVHQLLIESLVLTTGGAAAGLALAAVVVPLVPALFPQTAPLPRGDEVGITLPVILFALGIAGSVGVLFGVLPALRADRAQVIDALREHGRSIGGPRATGRRTLVVVEVALALVLVIGAGLMGRSLVALSRVDPGFDTGRVLTLRMLILPAKYRDAPARAAVLRKIVEEVRATPGVVSASSIHFLPLSGIGSSTLFYRFDRPRPALDEATGGDVSVIGADYFRTLGIPLVEGRDFTEADRLESPRVVIVNETLARRWFSEGSPIGRHLGVWWSTPEPAPFEIVGIAGDVRTSALETPVGPAIYLAHAQEPSSMATLVVRTVGPPAALAPDVRRAIARVDPDQGVSEVQPLEALVERGTAGSRVRTLLLGSFGLLALVIAAVGLYGVMAYGVERRRRELGVRMAFGAAPAALVQLVLREGLALTVIGIVIGTVLAAAASPVLAGLLYETTPADPLVFAGLITTLLLVATAALATPARRASRVDPAVVLRDG